MKSATIPTNPYKNFMQVTAICFDWDEVQKRTSAEQIVEEMILTDDIDIYAKDLPRGIWMSDSAIQYFEAAEQIEMALGESSDQPDLKQIAAVISTRDALDELGISPLTEGCYFISISPSRVESLLQSFQRIDLEKISGLSADAKQWIGQWRAAIEYAASQGYGIIGHCG